MNVNFILIKLEENIQILRSGNSNNISKDVSILKDRYLLSNCFSKPNLLIPSSTQVYLSVFFTISWPALEYIENNIKVSRNLAGPLGWNSSACSWTSFPFEVCISRLMVNGEALGSWLKPGARWEMGGWWREEIQFSLAFYCLNIFWGDLKLIEMLCSTNFFSSWTIWE